MKGIIRKNKLAVSIFMVYLVLMVVKSDMALSALGNSTYYLVEMGQILPVIFMLTVSIDVLIPKEWIVKRLGSKSGFTGVLLALAFGSLSAGPIYAAFPIAKTLHKKGASVSNVVVILSAWAVIKVPMLANEAKFLGPDFMLSRWVLTVVFIFMIGWIMERTGVKIQGEETIIDKEIFIKRDYCAGCSACEKLMPEVFAMREGKPYIIDSDLRLDMLNDSQTNRLQNIAMKCPSNAIVING